MKGQRVWLAILFARGNWGGGRRGPRLGKTLEFKFNLFGGICSPNPCLQISNQTFGDQATYIYETDERSLSKANYFFLLDVVPLFFSLSVTLYQSLPDNSGQSIKSMGKPGKLLIRVLTTHLFPPPPPDIIHLNLSNNSNQHIRSLKNYEIKKIWLFKCPHIDHTPRPSHANINIHQGLSGQLSRGWKSENGAITKSSYDIKVDQLIPSNAMQCLNLPS